MNFQTLAHFFLLLSFSHIALSDEYNHDKWNTMPKDQFRTFTAFVTSFDGKDDSDGDGDSDEKDCFGQPEWVAYEIRKAQTVPKIKRPSRWYTDKTLFKDGVAPDDKTYKHSGYDRGHLCMKHIASRLGKTADKETHTMLNACPQIHRFNAGIWLDLEKKTAEWADQYGKVWVICGPIWENKAERKYIGDEDEKKIPVPDKFFKIVAYELNNKLKVKSWLFPHQEIKKVDGKYQLSRYLTSVDKIESESQLDFFTSLEDTLENQIEAQEPTL